MSDMSEKLDAEKQNFQKKLLKLSQGWSAYIFPKNNLRYPDVKLHLQMLIQTDIIQKRKIEHAKACLERRTIMALENKLNITDSAELARMEEKISKKKAVELFEK